MRKRIVFSVCALAALLLSCNKQAESEAPQTGRLVTMTATCAESESRVVLSSSTGKTIWNKGDSVSIFRGDSPLNIGARFTGNAGATVGSITFQDLAPIGPGETVETVAAVPYRVGNSLSGRTLNSVIPAEQQYRKGSYAPKSVLLTAVTSDDKLKFRYACAVLCLEVKPNGNLPVSVQSVKLSSAKGEKIAGAVAVDLQNPDQPVVTVAEDGRESIVLETADGSPVSINPGETEKFYFCVAPVALSEGYVVEVALSEAEVLRFRNTAVRNLEAGTLSGIQCGISQSVSIIIDFHTTVFTPSIPKSNTTVGGKTYSFTYEGNNYSIVTSSTHRLINVGGYNCLRFDNNGTSSYLQLPSIEGMRLRSFGAMVRGDYDKNMAVSSTASSAGDVVPNMSVKTGVMTYAPSFAVENSPLYLYSAAKNTQIARIELYFE